MLHKNYSHIRPDLEEPEKVDYQTVKDHLLGTAERCAAFAGAFQAEQAGRAHPVCPPEEGGGGPAAGAVRRPRYPLCRSFPGSLCGGADSR